MFFLKQINVRSGETQYYQQNAPWSQTFCHFCISRSFFMIAKLLNLTPIDKTIVLISVFIVGVDLGFTIFFDNKCNWFSLILMSIRYFYKRVCFLNREDIVCDIGIYAKEFFLCVSRANKYAEDLEYIIDILSLGNVNEHILITRGILNLKSAKFASKYALR